MLLDRIGFYFPKALSNFLILYTCCICFSRIDILPRIVNVVLLMTLTSFALYTYWKIIRVGAGSPLEYSLLKIQSIDNVLNRTEQPPDMIKDNCIFVKRDGSFRFCQTCEIWKPDRCHHCSKCNKCFLKMDHHCPWFASCVGFRNQKFFVQFLAYTTVYSLYVLLVTSAQLYSWFQQMKYKSELLDLHLLVVWVLSVIAAIATFAFTSYTIWLVTKNETTIEQYEWGNIRHDLEIYGDSINCNIGSVDNVFDLGSRSANFNCVMGASWAELLLPIQVRADDPFDPYANQGLFFPVQSDTYRIYRESVNLQQRLITRLTPRPSVEHI
ncbi:Pfa3 [Kluyveromyces lactis]|nr:Pfa3 [Kluyveromyces lactis]